MRATLRFARLFAVVSIPLSIAAGQTSSSPIASPTATVSSAAATSPSPTAVSRRLIYKPPTGAGNIPTRVSGGARGDSGRDVVLTALVPDHVAFTTQAQ